MNYQSNKAAFMTSANYKVEVSPLIKAFNKFMKKNEQYFKKADYNGFVYLTFPEYFSKSLEALKKQKLQFSDPEKYIKDSWSNSCKTFDEVPVTILEQYHILYNQLIEYFGDFMNKIEGDETNNNKRSVRRAIDNNFYIEALKEEFITPEHLNDIFTSVGLRIPKNILELKNKIENNTYDRAAEFRFTRISKEFIENLTIAFKPHYDELRESSTLRDKDFINKFETKFNSDFKAYVDSFETREGKAYGTNKVYTFYKMTYNGRDVEMRKTDWLDIIEKRATDYADSFFGKFYFRVLDKTRVVVDRNGTPKVTVSDAYFTGGEFNGYINLTFDNGLVLNVKAQVIFVVDNYIQSDHFRYLLHIYHNGKAIDLENLDQLVQTV